MKEFILDKIIYKFRIRDILELFIDLSLENLINYILLNKKRLIILLLSLIL